MIILAATASRFPLYRSWGDGSMPLTYKRKFCFYYLYYHHYYCYHCRHPDACPTSSVTNQRGHRHQSRGAVIIILSVFISSYCLALFSSSKPPGHLHYQPFVSKCAGVSVSFYCYVHYLVVAIQVFSILSSEL